MEPVVSRVRLDGQPSTEEPGWQHRVRRASDLEGFVVDPDALRRLVASGDPVVYETFEAPIPEAAGHLMYGVTVVHPGKIGPEYYMTKGHFHVVRQTAEVYLGLRGRGYLVMEDEQGRFRAAEVTPGTVVYVPPGWAHRSVNTGDEPLVMLYAFAADAGHDYATIRERGFSHTVVERNGRAAILPVHRVRGEHRQEGGP